MNNFLRHFLRKKKSHIVNSTVSFPQGIHPKARVTNSVCSGEISLGEGSYIENCTVYGPVAIGRYSSINGPNTDIFTLDPLVIGSFCSIARNVSIQSYQHNYRNLTTYFIQHHIFGGNYEDEIIRSNPPISIGNDVWIGTQSVITGNAQIGHGAVIGANSVVTSTIPAYAIAVGSPAKVIKYRFEEEIINKLLQIKWWNWDIGKIKQNKLLFTGTLTMDKLLSIT